LTFGAGGGDDAEARGRLEAAVGALESVAAKARGRTLRVERIDEEPARNSALAPLFERAAFRPDYRGLSLSVR
jgi:hypothetical protein